MVFSGLPFLFFFLPLTLAAYFLVPLKFKKVVLFTASIIFYAWGEPVYVLLMLLSIAVNYILAPYAGGSGPASKRKAALVLAIIFDIGMLGLFKYAGLFISTINSVFGIYIEPPDLSLPIGISFYTFQAVSYVIDVYRKDVEPAKNPVDFGAYLTMFPQLIAGPIVRYKSVEREMKTPAISMENFSLGISRFIIGLGKKVLIANSIGRVWSQISEVSGNELSMATAWIGLAAFTLQIYFDFSGYSDMAIGMGRMLGFYFPENFDHPYQSKSITEFWRRWHMTLGTWFREYVYYPMGGSKKGLKRQLINIFVVWMLTGLWHGASWNFLIWGIYYALLLFVEKIWLYDRLKKASPVIGAVYTLFFVIVGWGIFSWQDMSDPAGFFAALLGMGGRGLADMSSLYFLRSYAILFVIATVCATDFLGRLWEGLTRGRKVPLLILESLICILSVSSLVTDTYNPFLYFRF